MEDYREEDRRKGKKSDEEDVDDDEAALKLGKLGGANPLAEEEKIEVDDTAQD